METLEFAKYFMNVLEEGDVEKARACYQPDASIWHNFDDKEQTVEENLAVLGWMMRKSRKRTYDIKHLEEIAGGYLQQHVLTIEATDGTRISMPACVVVRMRDGKIERIEEYLDPAPVSQLT